MADSPKLLTPAEAADLLRVSRATLRDWRDAKRARDLPFVKVGGRIMYFEADVLKWLSRQRICRPVCKRKRKSISLGRGALSPSFGPQRVTRRAAESRGKRRRGYGAAREAPTPSRKHPAALF